MECKEEAYVIGIDVGTGSARAGLFDLCGNLIAVERSDIEIYRSEGSIVEQSSDNIWASICTCVRGVMRASGVSKAAVRGIGVDATCSLVVLDKAGRPVTVSPGGEANRNVIVWMDHRAIDQADRINNTSHSVLRYVGNRISPEMQIPKLLWLKERMPETFLHSGLFFDLADFVTWRATGSEQRSICTTTCKWSYLAHERRWDASFFRDVGIGLLADEEFRRIGVDVVDIGTPVGSGLSDQAADELGLLAGTTVGAGLIDAHAGGVGTIGFAGPDSVTSRLAYVFGTSACTMATSIDPIFIPGVWGPYYSAMVPGYWLNEAGQSAAGAAIDHLVRMHPASSHAGERAAESGLSIAAWLGQRLAERAGGISGLAMLSEGLHIVPEFLGNRAPFADPDSCASIIGLDMDASMAGLERLYVAGICGLGYGLRQIINTQSRKGLDVASIVISGGAGQSRLVRQLISDATGLPVVVPRTNEPVLLGAAIAGAVAAGLKKDLADAMTTMSNCGDIVQPADGPFSAWHSKRFDDFCQIQNFERRLRERHSSSRIE